MKSASRISPQLIRGSSQDYKVLYKHKGKSYIYSLFKDSDISVVNVGDRKVEVQYFTVINGRKDYKIGFWCCEVENLDGIVITVEQVV